MVDNTQNMVVNWQQQLKIYCPLLPVLGIFIIFMIFLFGQVNLDFLQVTAIGTALCLVGFILTGRISSKVLETLRYNAVIKETVRRHPGASEDDIVPNIVEGNLKIVTKAADEEDLSLPAMLGTNGIYGIVIGL